MNIRKTLFTACAVALLCAPAHAAMTLIEEAIEFDTLDAIVSADGRGFIELKACDESPVKQLKVTPKTTLVVGGKQLPLDAINRGTLRGGTIFYKVNTDQIVRIVADQ